MFKDLVLVFYIWLLMGIWQFISAPFLIVNLKKILKDRGWAFARLITLLIAGIIIWFLAHFGLPVNTRIGIWLIMLITTGLSFRYFQSHKKEILSFLQQNKNLIIIEEIIFFVALLYLSVLRGFNANIMDLEKFMDAGFIVSYSKSPTLPAPDMWLAGEEINYYTFGHYLAAFCLQFFNITIDYGFNLMLAIVFAFVGTGVFSFTYNLLINFKTHLGNQHQRKIYIASILAVIFVLFSSNSHPVWYYLKNKTSSGYWYPDATRFIHNTIHEFPSYSFIVCDLHAHVLSLPIAILLLQAIYVWFTQIIKQTKKKDYQLQSVIKQKFFQVAIFVGFILGIELMTSAWDLANYSLLLFVLGIILLILKFKRFFLPLIISAGTVIISLLITALAWLINFEPIGEGIRLVEKTSPLWQLAVLWLGHFIATLLALVLVLLILMKCKKKKLHQQSYLLMIIGMIVTAWILIMIPEFVYVKDIYPDHPRANTMFKLTFQSFVLMSLVLGMLPILLKIKKIINQKLSILILLFYSIFIFLISCYPFFGYRDYYGVIIQYPEEPIELQLSAYENLDGLRWLKQETPGNYEAIKWLNENVDSRVHIIEAVGESYTKFNQFSTFTGLPTVLGWRVHEWLWRGEIPPKRTEEVALVYESPQSQEAKRIMNQYKIEYLILGPQEREAYKNLNENGVKNLGDIVFEYDNTYIIKL